MIALTERGQAIAAIGREVLLGKNASALCGFSTLEADILMALLHRLVANLEADEREASAIA